MVQFLTSSLLGLFLFLLSSKKVAGTPTPSPPLRLLSQNKQTSTQSCAYAIGGLTYPGSGRAVDGKGNAKLGSQSSKKPKVGISDNVNVGKEADVQGWESFCNEKKSNKFIELGVESIPIPVSVDDFYKLVLEDNADHSIEKFMRSIGEMEVESSPWQPSTTESTNSATRTIHYIHPNNAPMAPPTAAARKEQTLHKFGNIGLCLETCTFVENVPMADCLIVRDRLWVTQNEGSGYIMSITFQIDFIKGTLFRRIIENTTKSEYLKYWSQFWDMIKSNIGSSDSSDELA